MQNTARTNLAESTQHIYPMEHIKALTDKVPQQILTTHIALKEKYVSAKASGDDVPRDAATNIMTDLIDLITSVNDHHEQQDLAPPASTPAMKEPPAKRAA